MGQTLYSRRTFPFYSFCVLAGIDEDIGGHGRVHAYDAIGLHERVAIASARNGKEMLQPILDRLFARAIPKSKGGGKDDNDGEDNVLRRDGRAVHYLEQRVGLRLEPPVETCVECSAKEAVAMLVRGYRSVTEREISIGDNVVVCVISRRDVQGSSQGMTAEYEMEVMRFPLKGH